MDEHAQDTLRPTNEELQVLFTEALRESGDVTIDCVAESRALWMRGVLPQAQQVRPGDNLRGGVAMRTLGDEVLIHPYVMRQVCTNGAVLSHARSTRIVSRQRFDPAVVSAHSFSLASVSADVTAAVRNCASPEAFSDGVNEMRASLEVDADTVIENLQFADVLSSLGRSLSAHSVFRVLARIMRQASGAGGRERSAFALGNALTSAGRDAASPAVRWTLEEYGAAVFAASLSASAPPVATLRGRAIGDANTRTL
ncbi:MAG: hypothetical protein ABI910_09225 [Gemmatimonadota bacterium]